MTVVTARSVADPLTTLAREAVSKIGDGQLDSRAVDDGGEVGRSNTVESDGAGLRERRRLADLFGRHVGSEVARSAEQGSGSTSEQRSATAMFVDLVGSTALRSAVAPTVVENAQCALDAVTARVGAEGGWSTNSRAMARCVSSARRPAAHHAARALRSARALRQCLSPTRDVHPGMDAAIGISLGTVVAGNVGTDATVRVHDHRWAGHEAAASPNWAKGRPGRVVRVSRQRPRSGEERRRWLRSAASRSGPVIATAIFEPVRVPQPSCSSRDASAARVP